jgi:alkylation response protein AidB-like acyl-CoA dehydrogenase
MVEKIKRDVRITTIYEGTSEIQQNIISTFRWKKSRKTKGEFYGAMAAEMERLEKSGLGCGAGFYALTARALNHLIALADTHRLTRQQILMFDLAELMAHVEVGTAVARKAAALSAAGDALAERAALVARIFSWEVCQLFARNSLRILTGTGEIDAAAVVGALTEIRFSEFAGSSRNVIKDMDRLADIVFGR